MAQKKLTDLASPTHYCLFNFESYNICVIYLPLSYIENMSSLYFLTCNFSIPFCMVVIKYIVC